MHWFDRSRVLATQLITFQLMQPFALITVTQLRFEYTNFCAPQIAPKTTASARREKANDTGSADLHDED